MGADEGAEALLDTIGDREARRVLATLSSAAKSAKELSTELDLSLPTVYRRLEALQEHGLVESRQSVDDGTHFKRYVCTFESTVISLVNDTYTVQVYHDEETVNTSYVEEAREVTPEDVS